MEIELSIVSPVHNESGSIVEFIDKVTATLSNLDRKFVYELILVDDGSTDQTWELMTLQISEISTKLNLRFKFIKLASNYGQSPAILAGMRMAKGKFVITMDSDLQHPPQLIEKFFELRSESPVLVAVQTKRSEGTMKKLLSKSFYTFAEKISGVKIQSNAGDFRLIRRDILEQLLSIDDKNMVLRFAIAKLGIPFRKIDFEAEKRFAGSSNYTFKKMIQLAVESVLTLTTKPLRVSIVFSTIFFFVSIFQGLYILFLYVNGYAIPGWSSLALIGATGFMATFLVLTIQGIYLSKLFVNNQNYPRSIQLEVFDGDVYVQNKTI